MKAEILHNLSDDELEAVYKAIRDVRKHSLPSVRLPAANPAQAHISTNLNATYKKVMVTGLTKHLVAALEKES
jgi:hypothetical protein